MEQTLRESMRPSKIFSQEIRVSKCRIQLISMTKQEEGGDLSMSIVSIRHWKKFRVIRTQSSNLSRENRRKLSIKNFKV